MDRILLNSLKQLGCNEKHVRLYRAALLAGTASLPELARAARLQRSTAYLLAAELTEKGLLLEDHKNYRKQFVAAEPDTLFRMLEARHRQLGRTNLAFKEALPELRAAHQGTQTRPRVRTFEGNNGLIAVLQDILQERQEILLWTNQESEKQIFHVPAHNQFIAERIKREIPIRVLAVDDAHGRSLLDTDQTSLRETRILPPQMQFTSETYIYGDKVAVLDFSKNIFGVITENKQIAASQRAQFELAWSMASHPEAEQI